MSLEEKKSDKIVEASKINIESLLKGNLAGLNENEIFTYYTAVCEDLKLNYKTKPFDIIETKDRQGNIKKSLYPNKECAAQLRKKNKLRVKILNEENIGGNIYKVTTYATSPDGDEDEDIGTANIAGLRGDNLAEAMMKAVTRAKRRVILSISGLGFADEPSGEYESAPVPPERHSISVEKLQTESIPKIEQFVDVKPTEKKPVIKKQPEEEIEFSFGDEPVKTEKLVITEEQKKQEKPKEPEKPKEDDFEVEWGNEVKVVEKKKKKSTKKADSVGKNAKKDDEMAWMDKTPDQLPDPFKILDFGVNRPTEKDYERIGNDWAVSPIVMDFHDSAMEDMNITAYTKAVEKIAPDRLKEIEERFLEIIEDPNALADKLALCFHDAILAIKDHPNIVPINIEYLANITAEIERIENFCEMISTADTKTNETFMQYAEQFKLGYSTKQLDWAYKYATERGLF